MIRPGTVMWVVLCVHSLGFMSIWAQEEGASGGRFVEALRNLRPKLRYAPEEAAEATMTGLGMATAFSANPLLKGAAEAVEFADVLLDASHAAVEARTAEIEGSLVAIGEGMVQLKKLKQEGGLGADNPAYQEALREFRRNLNDLPTSSWRDFLLEAVNSPKGRWYLATIPLKHYAARFFGSKLSGMLGLKLRVRQVVADRVIARNGQLTKAAWTALDRRARILGTLAQEAAALTAENAAAKLPAVAGEVLALAEPAKMQNYGLVADSWAVAATDEALYQEQPEKPPASKLEPAPVRAEEFQRISTEAKHENEASSAKSEWAPTSTRTPVTYRVERTRSGDKMHLGDGEAFRSLRWAGTHGWSRNW